MLPALPNVLPIKRVGLQFPLIAELYCINGNILNFLPKADVPATPTVDTGGRV